VQDLPLVSNVLELVRVLPGARGATNSNISANSVNTVRDGMSAADSEWRFRHHHRQPRLVGEIRLILAPVDAELGRGQARPPGRNTPLRYRDDPRAAHPLSQLAGSRADFAETVYWNAGVRTDASTGVATVSFNLSDSVTAFRVLADAFDQNGTLGSGTSHVESVQPFSIEPKLPLQITSGDVIQLPIGIVNGRPRLRNTDISAIALKA
jgi:hypothetical protein